MDHDEVATGSHCAGHFDIDVDVKCGMKRSSPVTHFAHWPEGIKRQPGNNVLIDLAPAVRVGISLLPGS